MGVSRPAILQDGTQYQMYYLGEPSNGVDGMGYTYYGKIGLAQSSDGSSWSKYASNPVAGQSGDVYTCICGFGSIIKDGTNSYKMYYDRYPASSTGNFIFLATSTDGITWAEYSGSASHGSIFTNPSTDGDWHKNVYNPSVIYDADAGLYKMWYTSEIVMNGPYRIDYATSSDGIAWTTQNTSVLTAGSGTWDANLYMNCSVLKTAASQYAMFYEGYDSSWNMGIGLATSSDGVTWTKSASNPVLAKGSTGAWDSTQVGCPRIVNVGGSYYLFYTGYDGSKYRIGYATLQ